MKLTFNNTALSLVLASATAFVACGGGSNAAVEDDGQGGSTGSEMTGPGSTSSTASGSAATGTLVINEIMYNPGASSDETGEWIEIFNPTADPVNLEGWVLRDNGPNLFVIGAKFVEPGGYVVLGRSLDANGGAPVDVAYGEMFKLTNGLDAVVLENPDGEIVDEVVYDSVAPWPADNAGVSIELIGADMDNAEPSAWRHAVLPFGDGDLGTPGRDNGGTVQVPGFVVDDSVSSWHQPDLKTSIHFAPEDDLEAHVLATLGQAQTSIKLAFFNVRLEGVKDLLVQKMNAGVDVHVMLDAKQQAKSYNTMGDDLTALGVTVTLVQNDRAENATMHNKFAIIDGHLVMTGSANYSYTALNISDEDLITFDDAALAVRYATEFDEIIADENVDSAPYVGVPAIRAWMGPEDSLPVKVAAEIDAAQSTVTVAMFQLNASVVVDALIAAQNRGVNVVVMLDEVQATQAGETADEELTAAGVDVLLVDATGNSVAEMHSKFVVVDHAKVVMGSYNWTNMGSYYNDENILVIDDAHLAARVEGKFADMVGTYNASPTSMGLTTGMQPVTFSVNNVTMDAGLELVVVGDGPLANGVAFVGGSATVDVPAGTRLEYHYEVREAGSMVASETASHAFTVPFAPGPFAVTDAYMP